MTTFKLFKKEQFRHCQATEVKRQDEDGNVITIFYSYTCPEIVKIKGVWYRFGFENSRKAGSITGSRTTSKQITQWRGNHDRKNFEVLNLADFERDYFSTNIDGLY